MLTNLTNPDTHSYTLYVLIEAALPKVKNSYNVSLNESALFLGNMVESSPKCMGRVLNIIILTFHNFKYSLNRNELLINMSVGMACSLARAAAVGLESVV